MIKGTKDELDPISKSHRCPEHPDKALVVAWHPDWYYVIRCGAGHYPEEVTREPSLTQLYNQGEELPEPIKSNVEKGIRERDRKASKQSTAVTFSGIPATDLATGELLSLEALRSLVNYARRYHLDPARSHVMLMYGKPYIGIDGYLYHANREKIPYQLKSRPLDDEERKQYQIAEGAHAWIAEVKRLDTGGLFTGIGIVTQEEMTAKSKRDTNKLAAPVVAAHPWQLAQKRAEWQALRRAFPIGQTEEEKEE